MDFDTQILGSTQWIGVRINPPVLLVKPAK